MKDRIVENPNRYRLVPVDREPGVYDLMPEPGEVTEWGMPINKANLLSDETEELYGVETVDAALQKSLVYQGATSANQAFCANVNIDSLDAAFGKWRRDKDVMGLGLALAWVGCSVTDEVVELDYQNLINCNNLREIKDNVLAMVELLSSPKIMDIVNLSPYAKNIIGDNMTTYDFGRLLSTAIGVTYSGESYEGVISDLTNIVLMKKSKKAMKLLIGATKHSFRPIGKMRAIPTAINKMNSDLTILKTVGSGVFVVPENVFSITAVVIGGGGKGVPKNRTGYCGEYIIKQIDVIPDQEIPYTVGGGNQDSTFGSIVARTDVGKTIYGDVQDYYLPKLSNSGNNNSYTSGTALGGQGGYGGGPGGGNNPAAGGLTYGDGGGGGGSYAGGGGGYGGGGYMSPQASGSSAGGGQGVIALYM